jgi:nitrite reductase (NO-forming)
MIHSHRLVNRRSIVVSGITAMVGVVLARLPSSGREPDEGITHAGASPESTPTAALEISIEASSLRFTPSTIAIPALTLVRIVFTNRAGVYHDLVIPKLGRRTPRIGPDQSSGLLIRAEPGTYVFYCSIQGHHQAGMEGTITAR